MNVVKETQVLPIMWQTILLVYRICQLLLF